MRSIPKATGSGKSRRDLRWVVQGTRGREVRGGVASTTSDFAELSRQWPPRAIRSEKDLAASISRVEELVQQPRPTAGRKHYIETLIQLIEAYEREHHAPAAATGTEVLRELVEQHELSMKQLSAILEVSPSITARILKDERSLTVQQIKRLSQHFAVRSQVFLG